MTLEDALRDLVAAATHPTSPAFAAALEQATQYLERLDKRRARRSRRRPEAIVGGVETTIFDFMLPQRVLSEHEPPS